MDDDRFVPPRKKAADHALEAVPDGTAAVVGWLARIPGASALARAFFDWFFSLPYERRLEHWRDEIGETVRKLHEVWGISYEQLLQKEEFISVVFQATNIAARPIRRKN